MIAKTRQVGVNDRGCRVGEYHGRAKLSDHDVDLIWSLLECRDALIREYTKVGLKRSHIDRELAKAQLSYYWLAQKFEVSKSQIRWIALGLQRSQVAVRWKRVPAPEPSTCNSRPQQEACT